LVGAEAGSLGEWKPGGIPTMFLPDGKRVLLVGLKYDAEVWDLERQEMVGRSMLHTSSVMTAAVDAAGQRAGDRGREAGRIWDLESRNPIGPALRIQAQLVRVAFSPDGRLVAGLCGEGSARFWDAGTGRPIGPMLHHPGVPNALVFHPDGSTLFIAVGDDLE